MIKLVAFLFSIEGAHPPSLYRWSPFGALMYIHPRDSLHEAQRRSATVCVPVLRDGSVVPWERGVVPYRELLLTEVFALRFSPVKY